jgi:hypothetical protein
LKTTDTHALTDDSFVFLGALLVHFTNGHPSSSPSSSLGRAAAARDCASSRDWLCCGFILFYFFRKKMRESAPHHVTGFAAVLYFLTQNL